MKTRFNGVVSTFLDNFNISLNSNIFDDMFYEMLNLDASATSDRTGSIFHFDDSRQLVILEPSTFTDNSLAILLRYLEISPEKYQKDTEITIEPSMFFDKVIFNVLDFINRMSLGSPSKIKSYQEKSTAHFTQRIKENLLDHLKEIDGIINAERHVLTANAALLLNLHDRLNDLTVGINSNDSQDLTEAKHSFNEVWMIAAAKGGVTAAGPKITEMLAQLDQYCQRMMPPTRIISADTLFRRSQLLALKDKKLDVTEINLETTSPKM